MKQLDFWAEFAGTTYDPARDGDRLKRLLDRVYDYMRDGRWRTLEEISYACDGSEASVSARLRDLRKPKHGSHDIVSKYISRGLWEYRMRGG